MSGQIDDLYKTLIRFSKDFHKMNEYFISNEEDVEIKETKTFTKKEDVSTFKKNEEVFYSIEDEHPLKNSSPFQEFIIKNKSVTFDLKPDLIKNSNKFYDSIYNNKRSKLPVLKKSMSLNVWSILKDAVGKDLSKFCVPGIFLLIKYILMSLYQCYKDYVKTFNILHC